MSIPSQPFPADTHHMTDAEIIADLQVYLDELVAEDAFSGAVLIARNGAPLFTQAYGLASHSFQAPNRIDTKFNLGSMNKMFTAIAVAQLAEQGKLGFNDPIGACLPDYPNRTVADKVTVHHLLTHTSGLGDYFNETYERTAKDRFKQIADYFPLFVEAPLQFEPGERWSYSNAGFVALGAIIERVSGQTYFDYVREHIFARAEMRNTDAYELDYDTPNLAIGYTSRRSPTGQRQNNLYLHVVKGGPAGGGFSTVEDLLKFDSALRANVLLGVEYRDLVFAGKVTTGRPNERYAYGFSDTRRHGTRVVGHGGGFPGINGQLDMYLELGYTVAVLANYDPPAAARVADRIHRRLTGTRIPVAVAVAAESLARHTGRYQVEAQAQPGLVVEITSDTHGLRIQLPHGAQHRLLPLSETEFFDTGAVDIRVTFTAGEQDAGSELRVSGPGPTFTARKLDEP